MSIVRGLRLRLFELKRICLPNLRSWSVQHAMCVTFEIGEALVLLTNIFTGDSTTLDETDNNKHLVPVARERFFNRVVKTNLFQLVVWGRCKPPAVSGAEPRRQTDFDNNLLKIN